METITITKLYSIGDLVPASGNYVCVPCGYVQYFEAGALFPTYEACYAGTEIGPAGYQGSGSEVWQLED